VAGGVGEHARIDADLRHRPIPLLVELRAEDERFVGGDVELAIGANLGVQLAGAPAGVAEGEEVVLGLLPARRYRRAEHLPSYGHAR
jgi:hypothetical protein